MTAKERTELTRDMLAHNATADTLERILAQLSSVRAALPCRVGIRLDMEWHRARAEECKRRLGLWRVALPEAVNVARRIVTALEA